MQLRDGEEGEERVMGDEEEEEDASKTEWEMKMRSALRQNRNRKCR